MDDTVSELQTCFSSWYIVYYLHVFHSTLYLFKIINKKIALGRLHEKLKLISEPVFLVRIKYAYYISKNVIILLGLTL